MAATAAASLYFITQSTAILYPNTAYVDSEFKQTVRRVPFGLAIDVVYLSAVVVADAGYFQSTTGGIEI